MTTILSPCPFCEGPPCVSAFDDITGAQVNANHAQIDNEHFIAYAWCHECGAQGPTQCTASLEIFDRLSVTVEQLIERAASTWNDRHSNARQIYDASVGQGQCRHPQGGMV